MEIKHITEIKVGEDVAIENKERLSYVLLGVLDRSGSTQRKIFYNVTQVGIELTTVAKVFFNLMGFVTQGKNNLIDVMVFDMADYIFQKRFVEDRDHSLGC